jgi:membrane protein required for colicin V production
MPISWLDVILIAIMIVSGFLAMVRGFTREVLSIFSWAVAAVAALYLTPKYWHSVEGYFPSPGMAQVAFAAGVFVIVLIVVSLITFRISDRVLDSRVGALDRTLGFIFGLARGFLLVAIVFILFSALARDQPSWIVEAKSYPLLRQTQVAIESLMPLNPEQYLPGQLKPEGQQEGQPEAPAETPPGTSAPPAAAPAPGQRSDAGQPTKVASSLTAYDAAPRPDLDQQFESAGGSRD